MKMEPYTDHECRVHELQPYPACKGINIHADKENPYLLIQSDNKAEYSVSLAIRISYCPFCGEQL